MKECYILCRKNSAEAGLKFPTNSFSKIVFLENRACIQNNSSFGALPDTPREQEYLLFKSYR